MIWFTLALFALSFFASVLLAPKPDIENARPGKLGDIRWPITDEGSPAGTWVNYKQIISNKPHPLKDGDIIHIGEAGFRYQVIDRVSNLPITEEKTT